jgi:hypothetical protein
MSCKSCPSDNGRTFNGEIAIHFPGLQGLDKPIVWVFPELTVCLKCGLSEFVVPERELQLLVEGVSCKNEQQSQGAASRRSLVAYGPSINR